MHEVVVCSFGYGHEEGSPLIGFISVSRCESCRVKTTTNLYSSLVFFIWVCFWATACHHSSFSTDAVILAIDKGPDNLDPRIGTNSESERIDQLLFNSLVRRGPQLEILPDLATHWETPDPTTYR